MIVHDFDGLELQIKIKSANATGRSTDAQNISLKLQDSCNGKDDFSLLSAEYTNIILTQAIKNISKDKVIFCPSLYTISLKDRSSSIPMGHKT